MRLSIIRCLLNIIAYFQTLFVADAHLAEGQVLREEPTVNQGKFLKFRIGDECQQFSSKEGQHLKLL
jgi:hypothetical protein